MDIVENKYYVYDVMKQNTHKKFWENRCLVCDHIWESNSCTEPCSECGEENDIYSEEVSEERYIELLKKE
mgnify:FL=1